MKNLKEPDSHILSSGTMRLLNVEEIEHLRDRVREPIILLQRNHIRQSTGLVLDSIMTLKFKLATFHPLPCRSYRELANFLAQKHAIINVPNKGNRGFGYAILSSITRIHDNQQGKWLYNHRNGTNGVDCISYLFGIQYITAIGFCQGGG